LQETTTGLLLVFQFDSFLRVVVSCDCCHCGSISVRRASNLPLISERPFHRDFEKSSTTFATRQPLDSLTHLRRHWSSPSSPSRVVQCPAIQQLHVPNPVASLSHLETRSDRLILAARPQQPRLVLHKDQPVNNRIAVTFSTQGCCNTTVADNLLTSHRLSSPSLPSRPPPTLRSRGRSALTSTLSRVGRVR
jgi:hypothetical protein